jgi:thioredoxin reductase
MNTSVLIVGAGPMGLTAACELTRHRMTENAPPLAQGDMWTMRSSPIAGIATGGSAPLG